MSLHPLSCHKKEPICIHACVSISHRYDHTLATLILACHRQDRHFPSSCLQSPTPVQKAASHRCHPLSQSCLPSSMHKQGCQTNSGSPWKQLYYPEHSAWGQLICPQSHRLCRLPVLPASPQRWLCAPPESYSPPQLTK